MFSMTRRLHFTVGQRVFRLTAFHENVIDFCVHVNSTHTMADFDTIYEENDEESANSGEYVLPVPDPIIVRGAGNITL